MSERNKVVIDKAYLRARNASRRKMARRHLQIVEENYRTIFENTAVAITVADENENIVYWNKFAAALLGMDRDDLYMKPVSSLYPEVEWREIRSQNIRQKGLQHHLETKIVRKNQQIIDVDLSLSVLKGPDGEVTGSIGIISDITERKKTQEHLQMVEENYRTIFENTAVAITVADENENIVSWNKFAEVLLGMDWDDLYMKPVSSLYPEAEWREIRSQNVRRKGLQHHLETKIIRKNQQIIDVDLSLSVLKGLDGEVTGSIGIISDITERKRTQGHLQMVEENYRTIFENTAVAITVADENENIVSWNKFAEVLLGMDWDDLYMKPVSSLYPEVEWREIRSQNVRQKGLQHHLETRIIRKNQQIIDVDLSLTVLKEPDGEVTGSIGIMADITARKTARQHVQMVEENYRTIFENTAVAITVADENENIVSWNKFAEVLLGMDRADLYMKPVSSLYPEAEWREIRSQNVRRKGLQHHLETKIVRKNQQIIDVDLSLSVLKGPDGEVTGSIGIISDITDRKRTQEQLQMVEENYRTIFENTAVAITVTDENENIVSWNKFAEVLLGMNKGDLYRKPVSSLYPEAEWREVRSQNVRQKGLQHHLETRIIRKDHQIIDVDLSLSVLKGPDGEVTGSIGVISDITDRKRAQEALRKAHDELEIQVKQQTLGLAKTNEELWTEIIERKRAEEALGEVERRYKAIFDNRLQMVYINDEQGFFLDANDYALERLGYTRDDLGKVSFQDIIHPEDLPKAFEAVADMLTNGFMEHSIELRLIAKSGETIWIETFNIPLEQDVDHYIGIGIARDVTERKQAEEALRESEERLRALIENAPEAITAYDFDGTVTDTNKKAEQLFGYSREEMVGKNVFELGVIPDDYLSRTTKTLAESADGVEERPFEFELVRRDGSRIITEARTLAAKRGGKLEVICIIRDITKRKQMEAELQIKENAIENSLSAVAMCDMEGKITYVNQACMKLWGWDQKEELLGKPYWVLLESDDVVREIARTMIERQRWEGELVGRRRDGKAVQVQVFSGIVNDDRGNPVQTISSFTDITERKRAEEALRESEEKFRRLVEEMNDGYCVLQGSRVVFANARSAEMFGYTREEVIGRTVQELLTPEIVSDLSGVRAKRQRGEAVPQQYETLLVGKEGTTRPVELGTRVIEYAGKPALSVVVRDISERKQAEAALRRSEEHFRSLIENAQDAIVILNSDGTIRYESPSMERMTGREGKGRIGRDPLEFSHPDDMPNVLKAFSQLLENQTTNVHTELRLQHEDGSWRTFEVAANNLLENPTVAGIVLNLRDITERKQAEEEIRSLNEELEQRVIERTTQLEAVNKELEAFAYSVSHDLRAPLRSIDGFSQVLLEDYSGKLDEEGKDYLRRVRSASQRMADLIDDILNLSRLTRGEMQRETVDLSALAQAIATELQQSQPERQVEFIITLGLVVTADAHLLRVALENLLGNAWKFTQKQPSARIEFGYAETNGQSAYFVRDNGVGFDMAYADKLFGAFQRLHSSNEFEGTGVGLATVQRIIHRHGGNIWAESAVDQGTTFYFTL